MNIYRFKKGHLIEFDRTLVRVAKGGEEELLNAFKKKLPKRVYKELYKDDKLIESEDIRCYEGSTIDLLVIETIIGSDVYAYNGKDVLNITKQLKEKYFFVEPEWRSII